MQVIIILLVILLAFHMSVQYRQQSIDNFVNNPCQSITDCTSCAEKQECTWCTSSRQCLSREEIRGSDTLCNQVNLVHTPNMCSSNKHVQPAQASTFPYQINDKVRPPNVFLNDDSEYTMETVMAQTSQLRNELKNLQDSLPSMMAQTVHEQMRPMVKGIMCEPASFR